VEHNQQFVNLRSTTPPDWRDNKGAPLFTIDIPPGASVMTVVQPHWEKKVLPFLPLSTVVLKHCKDPVHTLRLNLVGYLTGQHESVAQIAIVGKLKPTHKAGKADKFADEEKGQLISILEELLLRYQSYCKTAIGFISDGVIIQVFQLQVSRESHQHH
jgi:hypothetical protein